eukprot:327693-Prymnesium_polylepis.1
MFAGLPQQASAVAFYRRCSDYDDDGTFRANDLTNMKCAPLASNRNYGAGDCDLPSDSSSSASSAPAAAMLSPSSPAAAGVTTLDCCPSPRPPWAGDWSSRCKWCSPSRP